MATHQPLGVVFVHGFLSSADVWSRFIRLLEADDGLPPLSLHTFRYATPPISLHPLRRIPDLDDVADGLRTFLAHTVADHRHLIVVSHSQGGLVVQRLLVRCLADGGADLLTPIRRVVMFACPNSGSELALSLRRRAPFWKHPQEEELRPLNKIVAETHRIVVNDITHAPPDRRIRITAYAGERDGVVTPASAKGSFRETGVLPGDHSSIVAPDSHTHGSYRALKTAVTEVLKEVEVAVAPVPRQAAADNSNHTPGSLIIMQHAEIVDRLLAVPGMNDPSFRQGLYDLLPGLIMDQLPRHNTARMELFALVQRFSHFPDQNPWEKLVTALAVVTPGQQPVAELSATLEKLGLVGRAPSEG